MIKNRFQNILIVLFAGFIALGHVVNAGENHFSAQKLVFEDSSLSDESNTSSPKNINGKNVVLSLLLPGLGEWVAGEKGRAKVFMVAELALWASYFGSREYANVIRNDYYTFAAVHAGVDTRNKDRQYWIDIGNYNSIYQLNERRRISRDLEGTYPEGEQYFWQWDSEKNRNEYSLLREKEDNWKRTASFVVGGMILNRIVSAVDIVRLIRKNKKTPQSQRHSYLFWDYSKDKWRGDVVQLNFTFRF